MPRMEIQSSPHRCRPDSGRDNHANGKGSAIDVVDELLERSHRLGADRRNTNYAGGNTSAKGFLDDPLSPDPAPVMWVKGSGGDLGTLQRRGLSVIRVDRLRALAAAYRGPEHEDEMVGLMRMCLHGDGGAPPSIDTAMHGLLDADHVDHLHPDACLALATAADGPELTRQCFGDRVLWVPWRRPGFQLGLDIQRLARDHPHAVGCILGGHGMTAWGATSAECEERSLWVVRTAADYLRRAGRADPLGPVVADRRALDAPQRRRRARQLFPELRRLAGTDTPVIGCWTDSDEVLDFLSRANMASVAGRGTSCPDHFIRTKVRPLIIDVPTDTPMAELLPLLTELHARYREDYRRYYREYADATTLPMRGADPAVVLLPGVGMFTFGRDAQTARLAGEFFVNAIHAMIGAESVSEYRPIADVEKFRIEYWSLEEAKLRRMPPPRPLSGRVMLVLGTGPDSNAVTEALVAAGASVVALGQPSQTPPGEVTWLSAGRGEPAGEVIDRAVLAHGGLDAVIMLGGPRGADEIAALASDLGAGRGVDLVLVSDDASAAVLRHATRTARCHRVIAGGEHPDRIGLAVVAALTSGAARSELALVE